MYFTPYVKHDGYYESICSLREGLGPILKCQAVIKSDGDYESIVRDYSTGKMVASKIKMMSYGIASDMAKILAVKFIISELDDIMAGKKGVEMSQWFGKGCKYLAAQWEETELTGGPDYKEAEPTLTFCRHKDNPNDYEGNCNQEMCPFGHLWPPWR